MNEVKSLRWRHGVVSAPARASALATVELAPAAASEASAATATALEDSSAVATTAGLELASSFLATVTSIRIAVETILDFARIRHVALREVWLAFAGTTGTGT